MKLADLHARPETVPTGWKTSSQWARAWRCSESHAQHMITAAVRAHTIRRRMFRVRCAAGVRPVPHYASK